MVQTLPTLKRPFYGTLHAVAARPSHLQLPPQQEPRRGNYLHTGQLGDAAAQHLVARGRAGRADERLDVRAVHEGQVDGAGDVAGRQHLYTGQPKLLGMLGLRLE